MAGRQLRKLEAGQAGYQKYRIVSGIEVAKFQLALLFSSWSVLEKAVYLSGL